MVLVKIFDKGVNLMNKSIGEYIWQWHGVIYGIKELGDILNNGMGEYDVQKYWCMYWIMVFVNILVKAIGD